MQLNQIGVKLVYVPSKEALGVLNERNWICSFSGGKDSTSLVTWVEWLRRVGWVKCDQPRLVLSDTEAEYPFLAALSEELMGKLRDCGWLCDVVRPPLKDKLYNQIFGRGITPIHPHVRKMRWCTKATKVTPMDKFVKSLDADTVQLTGVRWGESDRRDQKLRATTSCTAGGECGLPEPGEGRYAPIIAWKTCSIVEWLKGEAGESPRQLIPDLLETTGKLVGVYQIKFGAIGFGTVPPKVKSLRFGCVGCPALVKDKVIEEGIKHNPAWKVLRGIYRIWYQARKVQNRVVQLRDGRPCRGPIKMEARKRLFAEFLKIQEESGLRLVSPEDIAFIKQCWQDKVYPKGWSEADEN